MDRGHHIKDYDSYEEAINDCESMVKDGYMWFSGWYSVVGYSVAWMKNSK